jgi:predicted RNA binding protein YcfA (HicA-like mRNA interferase family)
LYAVEDEVSEILVNFSSTQIKFGVAYTHHISTIRMNSKQVFKRLLSEGWYLARVKGSHYQFKHLSQPGLVTLKHPDRDIPIGTLLSIEKQAGWR